MAGTWVSALLGLVSKFARFQSSQVVRTSSGFHLKECMGSRRMVNRGYDKAEYGFSSDSI